MTLNYREIAKSVIRLAVDLDHRLTVPTSQRIDSWTKLFDGLVWPAEATDAVVAHYRNPNAFPLLPGDVVGYCAAQPVWSSPEHAADWIMRVGVRYPYSGAIEAYSGIQEPAIGIPESFQKPEDRRAYLIEKMTAWATPRLDELAAAIVAKKFDPQAPR